MNNLLKFFSYLFIVIGVILAIIAIVGISNDNAIHLSGKTDWLYLKKVAETCSFLVIPWNIAGVFLLYLTLNIQQQQFRATDLSIKKQQFETTFFNMLNVLSSIIKSAYHENEVRQPGGLTVTHIKKEHEFFNFALDALKDEWVNKYEELDEENQIKKIMSKVKNNDEITEVERNIIRDDLNKIYLNFYKDFHSNLGHYFRYVFNLMKFVITRRSEYGDEKEYIDLIQAQLTNDELSLIFYNAISNNGLDTSKSYKFFNWLNKYNFFENIDDRSLLQREHHIIYEKTRFKFLNRDELGKKLA